MSQTGRSSGRAPARFSRRGTPFTLIEVLLALAILGIGLAGILSAYGKAVDALRAAQQNLDAFALLREKMGEIEEDFMEEGHVQTGVRSGSCQRPSGLYEWREEVAPGPSEKLLQVTVTMKHVKSGHSYSLSTYFRVSDSGSATIGVIH